MNPPQNAPAAIRELFFRLADRLQLDACVQAIAEEGKSVVLHSTSAGLLEHYGQLLVQRLRQQLPQTPTENFFPTHTEALIDTFNAMLEHVSVDDATQAGGPSAPGKLWVVHDASALPDHELKLMARLLQHLPGARVSAVLMLHGQAEVLRNLDPQGRRLMRWDIEPPTPEQIDQLVQEARAQGREFAALELVARLGAPTTSTATQPAATAAPGAAKPGAAASAGANTTAPASPAASSSPPPAPARGRRLAPLLAAAAGLLLLSVGVAAWLHPDAVQQLRQQLSMSSAPAPAPAASQAAAPAPAASAEATDTPTSGAATADGGGAPASEAASPNMPAPAATPPAPAASMAAASTAPAQAAAGAPANSAAAASLAVPTKAPEPASPSTKAWLTELPETALRGQSWLRQLDKETWVIEHGRHASVQAARKQLGADKLLANARIVPVVRQGVDTAEFLLVTGPFRSPERARNFAARHELPSSAKVHATAALLAMTPAGQEAGRP